jgi:hypothetical protein
MYDVIKYRYIPYEDAVNCLSRISVLKIVKPWRMKAVQSTALLKNELYVSKALGLLDSGSQVRWISRPLGLSVSVLLLVSPSLGS